MKKQLNQGGNDLSYMLADQMKGRIDSWAIRWVYAQSKRNQYTVYPVPHKSMIKNAGMDFSGTHSSFDEKYIVEVYQNPIKVPKNIWPNQAYLKEFKKFYNLTYLGIISMISRRLGMYKYLKKIRKSFFS